jgi:phage gp16-like protein
MLTPGEIKLIHTAKNAVGLSEEEYRDLLAGYGASSCKELTSRQLNQIIAHLSKFGFQLRRKTAPRNVPRQSRDKLQDNIRAVLAALGKNDAYANAIVRARFGLDNWTWLDAGQTAKLAAMLNIHARRVGRRAVAGADK